MAKLVRKKVLGTGMIPKFNMRAPLIICETEDFFNQLKAMGFKLEDYESENETKNVNKNTNNISTSDKEEQVEKEDNLTVSSLEDVSISIEGGEDYSIDSSETIIFEQDNNENNSVQEENVEETTISEQDNNENESIQEENVKETKKGSSKKNKK